RRVFLPQKARRLCVGFRGAKGGGAEPALKRRVARTAGIGFGGERLEEGPGRFLAAPGGALIGADQRLASRRHDPTALPLAQRRPRRLAVGGVVGHLGVVTGDATRRGEDGVKHRRLIDVAIAQLANGGDGVWLTDRRAVGPGAPSRARRNRSDLWARSSTR